MITEHSDLNFFKPLNAEMFDEVDRLLVDNFDRLGMDLPNNFEEILDFVYWYIHDTADKDNWNDSDVIIAFRRWIESQSNEQ